MLLGSQIIYYKFVYSNETTFMSNYEVQEMLQKRIWDNICSHNKDIEGLVSKK